MAAEIGTVIVVAVDGSECATRAFDQALKLAALDKSAKVHVLYAKRAIQYDAPGADELGKAQEAEIAAMFAPYTVKAKEQGANCTTHAVAGDPRSVIEDFVKARRVDYVVTGARGLSKLQRLVLGSVSSYLVQNIATPVIVVK